MKHALATILIGLVWASSTLAGRLVLIGGGPPPQQALRRFVEWGGQYIVIVPWASDDEAEASQLWVERLSPYRPGRLEVADRDRIREQLAQATAVFFTGGDQTKLMGELTRLELVDSLHAHFESGLVVGGTSAGTAIQSRAMITPEGLADGLGLLPRRVIVDQHFLVRKREARLLAAMRQRPGSQGLGIDEGMAVALDGPHLAGVFGPTEVRLYGCDFRFRSLVQGR